MLKVNRPNMQRPKKPVAWQDPSRWLTRRWCAWVCMSFRAIDFDDPYRGSAIWPSNSLDKTATPFLILDRGVEFWGSKGRIFQCMQRNRHFFKKLTNVSHKIHTFLWKSIDSRAGTPIKDLRSDLRILSTKQPLHFWSSIGISISEPPKAEFLNVCNEITTFLEN